MHAFTGVPKIALPWSPVCLLWLVLSTVILDLSTAVTTVVSTLYDFLTTSILCMVLTMHVVLELYIGTNLVLKGCKSSQNDREGM